MQRTNNSRLVFALLITASLLVLEVATPASADALTETPLKTKYFMTGLACIESGGRYDAQNPRSGAYGKYQIMPKNWPAWAARYLNDRWAATTPQNQEYVARQRISDLYAKRGSWRRVAYWWLTGDGEANENRWSDKALNYVDRVMAVAVRAASRRMRDSVPRACFPRRLGQPKIRTEPRERVQVTGGRVNIRRGPGYEYRLVTAVRRGVRLVVLDNGRDRRGKRWFNIGMRDGRTGWIAGWYTEPIGHR